jgi:hypothetical protein
MIAELNKSADNFQNVEDGAFHNILIHLDAHYFSFFF